MFRRIFMKQPVSIKVESLTAESFAPFGKVLALPSAPPTGSGRNYEFWAELAHLPHGNSAMGMLKTVWDSDPINMLEGHTEAEMIICVEKPVVILAAKPGNIQDANAQPKAEETRTFLLQPGQGVLFDAGTWHYVPMPLQDEGLCIFIVNPNMKGRGPNGQHWVKFAGDEMVLVQK